METPETALISRRLWLLLLLALGVRLAWGLSRPTDPAAIEQLPDQREYLELSDNLLHGSGLHFVDPRFGDEVHAYRTPGYPLFLAACGASPRVARIAQAFIDTSTILAIYLLARRWLGAGQSLMAAVIVAINPFLIYFSGLILSETLFTAMLTWGMLLLVGSSERDDFTPGSERSDDPDSSTCAEKKDPGRRYAPIPAWFHRSHPLLGGVVPALAVLVRPSGIGLPVVLGIVAALLNRRSRGAYPGWWPFPPGTTMLLFTVLALAPWAYRNSHVLGHWIWTTTNAGITAYDGFNDDATGASDQRFALKVPGILRADELQRNEFFAQEASAWVKHHPRRVLELAVKKIIRTWSPVPLSSEYGKPLYRWIGGLFAVPLYVMVVLGLCFGCLPRGGKVYLLIPAIYITAVHAMSVGSLRYRLPAEPVMAILAVASCQLLVSSRIRYVRWGESPSSLATDN